MSAEISQLAHFSKRMTDEDILEAAKQIEKRRIQEQVDLAQQKANLTKKSWYTRTMGKLQDQLYSVSNKTLDLEQVAQKFELEKAIEKQKLQKAIEELGEYKGQCLHLGGTRQSAWITDRYDSHGYQSTLCKMCGKEM
jgi:hypothetical protein